MAVFNGDAFDNVLTGAETADVINAMEGNDVARGLGGRDTISGGLGEDQLYGGLDNDNLNGNQDNDRLYGEEGDDLLTGALGEDLLDGGAGLDTANYAGSLTSVHVDLAITGRQNTLAEGWDTLVGIENLRGTRDADILYGNNGANRLDGNLGMDQLFGRGGDDVLVVTAAPTGSVFDGGAGYDVLEVVRGGSLADSTLVGIEEVYALSGFAATVEQLAGLQRIVVGPTSSLGIDGGMANLNGIDLQVSSISLGAGDGVDISGKSFDVTIHTGGGATILGGGGRDYVVAHEDGVDIIDGGGGSDHLNGGGGDDQLKGGAGDDLIKGGDGFDIAVFEGVRADYVITKYMESYGVTRAGDNNSLYGIEQLRFADGLYDMAGNALPTPITGTANADVIQGSAAVNVIAAGAGDDVITGGLGNDTIDGGAGVDLAQFAEGLYTVSVNASTVTVNGPDGIDTLTNVERLRFGWAIVGVDTLKAVNRFGTSANETLTGSATADALFGLNGHDLLDGGDGDDVLVGGEGADLLKGGAGFDTVDYSNAPSGVTARLDSMRTTYDGDGFTDTFSSIEAITGSTYRDLLTGGALNDVLKGGLGADTLLGFAGNDVLWGGSSEANTVQGGLGDDRYILEANDSVIEAAGEGNDTIEARINAYTLALNVEALVFGGTGNFAATGNAQANAITGGAGDDNLRGRGGVDVLNGGAGVDTVDYTLAAAGVTARLDTNRATNDGDGATDTFTGVENLTGSIYNDVLIGDGNANVLKGGIGTDTLLGYGGDDILWGGSGGGNNQLQGGAGNDYYVLDAFDTVVELAGEGVDTVEARIGSYTMGANIEKLLYVGGTGTFVGTGNTLDNIITGGNGNDILRGRGGNDLIDGGLGKDEIQMRGLAADYTVTVEGAGYRIVDKVAGRDGSTLVSSIEVIRWSNNTVRTLSYPPVAASIGEPSNKGGAEVSPLMAADADDFLLPALADSARLSLTIADAFDGFDAPSSLADRLFLGLDAQLAHHDAWMPMLDHDGLVPVRDGHDWAF